MKKFRGNILSIALVLVIIFFGVVMIVNDTNDNSYVYTDEVQAQATVTYVLKTQQYIPAAHQMLYTVRYDLIADGITKTVVKTSYTVMPKAWQLEEGDVVECTVIITYDNEGNIISKTIK